MHMNQCRITWKPGAQYFAKRHRMQTVGSRDRITNLPISGRPLWRMSPSFVHACGRAYVCVHVCTWTPTVVAAHCTAVISGLTHTWDQWRGSSEEAAAWQLALITFSTLRNSTLYMPLTGARTVILTQPCRQPCTQKAVCERAHTHTRAHTRCTGLCNHTADVLDHKQLQHLPSSPKWERERGMSWWKGDI